MPTPLREIPVATFYDLAIVGWTVWCTDPEAMMIRGFALETGEQVASFAAELGLEMHASTAVIAAGQQCRTLHDAKGKPLRTLAFDPEREDWTTVDALDRAGKRAVGSAQNVFVAWDVATGKVVHRSEHGYWAHADIAPDGSRISLAKATKPLVLVDGATFARRTVTDSAMKMDPQTTWSPDGTQLVMTANRTTLVVDAVKGVVTQRRKTPRSRGSCFIPGTDLFVMGDGRLTVFDTKSWQVIGAIDGVDLCAMGVSEDGMHLATAADNGPIQIWSVDRLLDGLVAPAAKARSRK